MKSMSHVAERFPEISDEIIRLCSRDELFEELCGDYEEVLRVLETKKGSDTTPSGDARSPDDPSSLEQLAITLELELLRRLAITSRNKDQGGAG